MEMLRIGEAEAEEIVEVMKNVERGCELEDREIRVFKGYLGRG